MIIILLSLAHLAVDGACAALLFSSAGVDAFSVAAIYNTVAFSTQALTGLLTDRLGRCKLIIVSSCALISAFCFMPAGPILRAIAVGCGNSFFHVAAGSIVLRKSSGKAGSLGGFCRSGLHRSFTRQLVSGTQAYISGGFADSICYDPFNPGR